MSDLKSVKAALNRVLKQEIVKVTSSEQEMTVEVKKDSILKVLNFLRDDPACLFKVLIDICGVDYPERPERFEVVYHLLSLKHNLRLRVKLRVNEEGYVPSVIPVYSTADWLEREAWDMFGILFSDHPDLRRILTDYEFEGHPLRKDFPLTGYLEVRYDELHKKVIYEPVSLPQEFRTFDFLSPWEGMLAEDEKAK